MNRITKHLTSRPQSTSRLDLHEVARRCDQLWVEDPFSKGCPTGIIVRDCAQGSITCRLRFGIMRPRDPSLQVRLDVEWLCV